ncbi:efflux transporter outer membrane subunit [Lichenicoccus sp.]|uniref:efflux transporter outer membrane subunit n=1 Tax=Lichenicoccus sp. TaxID=2781899 RepID=UPI003D099F32
MKHFLTAAILLPIGLAACTVGPDFTPPPDATPPHWHDPAASLAPKGGSAGVTTQADPQPDWWKRFDDPELTALIARAAGGNLDQKVALQRIEAARATEISEAAAGLPSLKATGSYTDQQSGLDALKGQIGGLFPVTLNQAPPPYGLFEGAVDASWELDLFGKVRRSVEASEADSAALLGDRADSLVSLQAEVAQTYAKLRAAQAALAAANTDIATERNLLRLTTDRASHGLTSDLDVRDALAQLASSQASAPQYAQQIATDLNSLAVLLGQAPGALDAELAPMRSIPRMAAAQVPIGLPSGLARRRPDIRAAEARLHEQTADVGAAIAELYPDITLTGEVGQQSGLLKNIAKSYNSIYSFGPSISLPIFQAGKLRAGIAQARAQRLQAAFTYKKTVLSALQDVENALASYRTDVQRLAPLQIEDDADQDAVDIALDRYRHGLSNYIDVLNPQSSLISVHQSVIQAQVAVTDDLVSLYKALGGGWEAGTGATTALLPGTSLLN